MNDEIKSDNPALTAETAPISAKGSITVSWQANKQSNDIWRAFEKIGFIAFEDWKIKEDEAKAVVKKRAEEKYDAGKARYYTQKAGNITFKDDGSIT